MICFRSRATFAALSALLWAAACASPAPDPEFRSEPGEQTYLIGAGDVLRISVWKNPELAADVPVRPDGMISVALLDDIRADGLTALELKAVISTELAEFISNPDVTVVVLQTTSKRVFVLGEVKQSGPVPLSSELRVLDVISIAGGFNPFADRGDIRVIRLTNGVEREYRFDYDAYLSGSAAGTNIVLQAGDTIVVTD